MCSASGTSGGQESACGGHGVWAVAIHGAEDVAVRGASRLKEEYLFSGGYTIAKDLCAVGGVTQPELFVPLGHPPGKALVVIAGVEHKAHYLAMDLPHSDDAGDGTSP